MHASEEVKAARRSRLYEVARVLNAKGVFSKVVKKGSLERADFNQGEKNK